MDMEIWIRKQTLVFLAARIRLHFFKIHRGCLKLAGSMVALSKHVIHYDPRPGLLYYNLTTPTRGHLLSATWGRVQQICGFEPWQPSPVIQFESNSNEHGNTVIQGDFYRKWKKTLIFSSCKKFIFTYYCLTHYIFSIALWLSPKTLLHVSLPSVIIARLT
jgi:hypothetical protein